MATDEKKDAGELKQTSLLDSEITTAKVERRSFLARAVGAGALAVGAVLTTACGDEADDCDADIGDTGTNADVTNADLGDRCDNDT